MNAQGAQVSGLRAVSIVGFGVPQRWPGGATDDLDDLHAESLIYIYVYTNIVQLSRKIIICMYVIIYNCVYIYIIHISCLLGSL